MASLSRRALAQGGIAVLPLVVVLGVAHPAAACSGFLPEGDEEALFREDLRRADAAIVGRLIEVRPVGSQTANNPRADFRYRIERVYKGKRRLRRGRVVTVRSRSDEGLCGLPAQTRKRYGLLLHLRKGRPPWRADLFDVVSPRALRAAVRGSPA